ncbi:MAG: hypothetical protein HYR61_13095 [Acidobacteria bacterium]|nr:hypothetical protein [Acidobacteriota bacterium]
MPKDAEGQLASTSIAAGPVEPGATEEATYFEEDGSTWYWKQTFHGKTPVKLCNFTARITEEISLDDGSGRPTLAFVMKGHTERGEALPEVTVLANEFDSLRWVPSTWGTRAILYAGPSKREHLRAAIQILSGHPPKRRVLEHLGWTRHERDWVYLHAGGALGAGGVVPGVEVQLEGRLRLYNLPAPATEADLELAWEASLTFLDAGPIEVTGPLWLTIFRAAMGGTNYSLHLVGTPEAGKSELAALVTGHFGPGLDPKNALACWEDTDSSIEKALFQAKDSVGLVDDFRPGGTSKEADRAHAKADRVFRGAFNGHGRARLRSDTTSRPDYYPRGLTLSTGEDLPRGLSLQTRVLMLRLPARGTDWAIVTQLQKDRAKGVLTSLLSAFLVWAAPRREELLDAMKEGGADMRLRWVGKKGRTADITSNLYAVWAVLRPFAFDMGLSTDAELDRVQRRLIQALEGLMRAQDEHLEASDPAEQFRSLLIDALLGGRGHLLMAKGDDIPQEFRAFVRGQGDQKQGECAGYLHPEGGEVWLNPGVAYSLASELARKHGTSMGLSTSQLWKRLSEKGWVIHQEVGRNTAKRSIPGGARLSFVVLRLKTLFESIETTETIGTGLDVPMVSGVPE